jgi:hypothetical protein
MNNHKSYFEHMATSQSDGRETCTLELIEFDQPPEPAGIEVTEERFESRSGLYRRVNQLLGREASHG